MLTNETVEAGSAWKCANPCCHHYRESVGEELQRCCARLSPGGSCSAIPVAPPPLPVRAAASWRRLKAIQLIVVGAAVIAVACGLLLYGMSGGDEKISAPAPSKVYPIAVEDPSVLRSRAEGTALELHAAAHRLIRTHRALSVAEDASTGNDGEIAGITSIERTKEEILDRLKNAHEDSRLFSAVFLERREEIRSDNILYIDSLVRLASFPLDVTDPLLEDHSVRVRGLSDKETALDLIRVHLDATRQASGKLDEERVFEDFKKSVSLKP